MSFYRHVTRPYCGVHDDCVHAVDALADGTIAVCGVDVQQLALPTTEGWHVTVAWPPHTGDLRQLGYVRCRPCMTARPGRPQRLDLITQEQS